MKTIYTFGGKPAQRTVTVADLRAQKGLKTFVQVTANTIDEASAVQEAGIDMMVCDSVNTEIVRSANHVTFLTAALKMTELATLDDIMREAFRVLHHGADAVITPRSLDVVAALAREDIPVMGHLGLVPRKSTWVGGLRAIGKRADEAFALYQQFQRLEDAGAFAVESEVIAAPVMTEISSRTSLVTISLGSGRGADVMFLFMPDLCGETKDAPRHARAFGDLARLHEELYLARVKALTAFRSASMNGEFPGDAETASTGDEDLARFKELLDGSTPI